MALVAFWFKKPRGGLLRKQCTPEDVIIFSADECQEDGKHDVKARPRLGFKKNKIMW